MQRVLTHTRCFVIACLLVIGSVKTSNAQSKEQSLHDLNTLLVNTVMTDLFTPIVASRVYVYPSIAFYECIRLDDPTLPALTGKLNGLQSLPIPPAGKKIDPFIAACVSFS
ncbi:MAG TPA: hypothetical protein PLQ40_00005, partial [Ferruginibacter sp.]|nr:hypothetical protein [Ferruginibacter sp.]